MAELVGYARVSTRDQELRMQVDALRATGCSRIFEEKASGARTDRPERQACFDYMRPGDTLVVWSLDRLGRNLADLVNTVEDLRQRGIEFRSLHENIDTGTVTGKLVFHIFAALAEFVRERIRENTRSGLEAARARGRLGGRSKVAEHKLRAAASLYRTGQYTMDQIAVAVRLSRSSLYKYGIHLLAVDESVGAVAPSLSGAQSFAAAQSAEG